ncbi:GAF domain-containing protein [Haloplanus rubicundus]|uniref:histidine kinase n=1 Tax=Haloplanus rubicundus TaxID=1547898 RepID=A0A345E1D7_9EURY|nr:GAF domain-containing protein [Haloplanus rubicundus]
MERVSARTSGTVIAVAGLVLAVVHLQSAVRLRASPRLLVVEAMVPLVLALIVAGIGGLLREERLGPAPFADRTLGWTVVGTVALVVAVGWLFADAAIRGQSVPGAGRTVLNAATLGAVVGLVVGIYDARGQCQRRRAEQLTRINDTLRIATQEMVNATERDELEAVVCERLTDTGIYDGAWIGRYVPGDEFVRPSAWAGHDDKYFQPLEVAIDIDSQTEGGPGSEAIRTGELQPIQNVFAEPSLEPWWDMLAEKGVESMAVVPLVGSEHAHGFLTIYANRANVFDTRECEALSELGESIGHAIDSMTARKQLGRRERELARQNERLDEFASVVSHDLRNPLNVAHGNLELARMDVDDDRLGRVADALDRMDELIDDLLTLARYGRTVDDVQPVDVRSVAERAWATTETEGAQLRFDDDPGTVEADESRLTQVFENLFRNSVEHSSTSSRAEPGDSVEHGSTNRRPAADEGVEFTRGGETDAAVTVTVGRTADGFYVEDDGPGIPESERDRVFEGGYTTADGGTGFGLNIVRTVAEAHGWTVAVTEGAAGGARFEFTTAGAEATRRER